MLVNLQTIIGMAEKGGYCIPAFNVYNTETVMGVIAAAEEAKAPVSIWPSRLIFRTPDRSAKISPVAGSRIGIAIRTPAANRVTIKVAEKIDSMPYSSFP